MGRRRRGSPGVRIHVEKRAVGAHLPHEWTRWPDGGCSVPQPRAWMVGPAGSSVHLVPPTGRHLPPCPDDVPARVLGLTQRLPACAFLGAGISRLAGLASSGPAGCCGHWCVCVCVCVCMCAQLDPHVSVYGVWGSVGGWWLLK